MKGRAEDAICRFGAGTISRYVAALSQEIAGVRLGTDIEAIHRMRVASRRLRSALPLFEKCYAVKYRAKWQKGIRQVTRALGMARDTDVQIERLSSFLASIQDAHRRPGVHRLILRLKQRRNGLQAKVNLALEALETSQILSVIEEQNRARYVEQGPGEPYSSGLYFLAKDAVLAALNTFVEYEKYISDPTAIAELHAMRIAAKHLRYTLEIFSPLYADELKSAIQAVKTAQEMLGDVHDCDVWAGYLPVFLEEERKRIIKFYGQAGPYNLLLPGIANYQEDRRLMRQRVYEEFLTTWEKWKEKDLWNNLIRTVELPTSFRPSARFYPPAAQIPKPDMENAATELGG